MLPTHLYPPRCLQDVSSSDTSSSSSSETYSQSTATSSSQPSEDSPTDLLIALTHKSLLYQPENRFPCSMPSSSFAPIPPEKHRCLAEDLKEIIDSKQTAITKIKSLKLLDIHPHKQKQLPQILQKQF